MLPASLEKLIENLSQLPGVGRKTAERYAYFLLRSHRSLRHELGEILVNLQNKITLCTECFTIAERSEKNPVLCAVCSNLQRDKSMICVVEHVFDAEAIERSGEYRGVYHILHGRIAPLDEVTPDDIKIKELVSRIKRTEQNIRTPMEIILATNPSSEGEATALYLQKLLKPLGVKLTRIATGIPVGADVEYADEVTLARALKGRHNYDSCP